MTVSRFPNPKYAETYEGILAVGGQLTTDFLLEAYTNGIFPWPIDGLPLTWFCPDERAILEFADLHIPRSLAREAKRSKFRLTIDKDFKGVITNCAKVKRPAQNGTWITKEMLNAYCEFHRLGYVHSVEVWEDEKLVGGIYGVDAEGTFTGESMFHLRPYASKLALLYLIDHLKNRGLDWMDIQVMSPHMEVMGAKSISRSEFLDKLAETQKRGLCLF